MKLGEEIWFAYKDNFTVWSDTIVKYKYPYAYFKGKLPGKYSFVKEYFISEYDISSIFSAQVRLYTDATDVEETNLYVLCSFDRNELLRTVFANLSRKKNENLGRLLGIMEVIKENPKKTESNKTSFTHCFDAYHICQQKENLLLNRFPDFRK